MGSIPVGSTKKQTRLCLLLLSRLEIEGRRSVVPIPERSAGSLLYGSTKTTVKTVVFYTQRRIERLLTQPDSRTLGRLTDTREYQKKPQYLVVFYFLIIYCGWFSLNMRIFNNTKIITIFIFVIF